jgi:hypothetical protein
MRKQLAPFGEFVWEKPSSVIDWSVTILCFNLEALLILDAERILRPSSVNLRFSLLRYVHELDLLLQEYLILSKMDLFHLI